MVNHSWGGAPRAGTIDFCLAATSGQRAWENPSYLFVFSYIYICVMFAYFDVFQLYINRETHKQKHIYVHEYILRFVAQ